MELLPRRYDAYGRAFASGRSKVSAQVFRTSNEAVQAARRVLDLGATCEASQSRYEIMRATLWGIAGPSGNAHVNRVLGCAFPTWRLISERTAVSEENFRSELRDALSILQDSGDLIELSGGYWAPATARFVALPEDAGSLLVGGVPSALLSIDRNLIQHHGPYRHFRNVPSVLANSLPVEAFSSWARLPDLSLPEWGQSVIDSLERLPYLPNKSEAFEFYLPEKARPWAPQFKRWSENAANITGIRLARRTRLYGAREYRLVDVRSGQIVRACEFQNIDVLRFMYALDLAAKNPVRARPFRVGDRMQWHFTSELPRPEQRTFAALGSMTIPRDRPFERRWTFERNEELALGMLRSLGIVIGQQG